MPHASMVDLPALWFWLIPRSVKQQERLHEDIAELRGELKAADSAECRVWVIFAGYWWGQKAKKISFFLVETQVKPISLNYSYFQRILLETWRKPWSFPTPSAIGRHRGVLQWSLTLLGGAVAVVNGWVFYVQNHRSTWRIFHYVWLLDATSIHPYKPQELILLLL